jgi:23S rRNA U2552 (ribose-2'-O)-methylase RlmE/FtsJ
MVFKKNENYLKIILFKNKIIMSDKFNISFKSENFNFLISLKENILPEEPNEQYGYNQDINEFRNKIDNIKNEDWKKVRWLINEYDFLVKDPIINRAFYKYWEIINEFEIFENYDDNNIILHCAEAPGGFIQGTSIYLQIDRNNLFENENVNNSLKKEIDEDGFIMVKKKNKKKNKHKIYSISLNKDLPQYKAYNLPSYNKNILNKKICITYGKDNTGDINNWENINYINDLAKDDFFLITADGGFDEGTDFNNKEQLHYFLILSEIYSAIKLQKENGHFILKVFDVFTQTSINLLYLLSLCYNEVYIYKPKTSRPTNSEKYVICKNFVLSNENKEIILNKLNVLYKKIKSTKSKYISFELFEKIPSEFKEKIKYMNSNLLNKQCKNINYAVSLCENDEFLSKYDNPLEVYVEKRKNVFKEWEEYYNLNTFI